ncbi:cobyric acid synthase [Chitinispirillales bacterium ANBcel5]|uniref:cobyric acid synthase n=1 Tax=Cellulosispirillum alkaliphilum TaxID=3039283 RepID=UPI002A56C1DD|nr:cobyric acid synthase [Chitinispirillales bacterium ANBcel5]
MMKTKSLMIQGTASSSGKSLIAAALCRILFQDGFKVAPFKAQNMSNNSFVTTEGMEMGRAQVVQAYAAGLAPDVRMNPVLLKPSSDTGAQVVLNGKPSFTMHACDWHQTRDKLRDTVRECYRSISNEFEVMIIEGAGSPAEINLKKNDIVNMGMAQMADAPVVIVGDIDRGGVFASLVGTVQLLEPYERQRVKGFIINKFRGDVELLKPGLDQLTQITKIPTLGVIPWLDHSIDDEDGVTEWFHSKNDVKKEIDICIIRLPHVSNFTDFLPLEHVPGVAVRWCSRAEKIGNPDLLILPGTKATVSDLRAIKKNGVAESIISFTNNGGAVLGVCGGFQMLGNCIKDEHQVESSVQFETGLKLLDMETGFLPEKRTAQIDVKVFGDQNALFDGLDAYLAKGYEIHMGESTFGSGSCPFTVSYDKDGTEYVSGITDKTGRVSGSYVHGLFDSGKIVCNVINKLRRLKGLMPIDISADDRSVTFEAQINRLAAVCRETLDIPKIYEIISVSNRTNN